MTILDLIAQFRREADDQIEASYLWDDDTVVSLFNDAVDEACRRKSLLFEATNPAICQISVLAGQTTYPLHPSITYISSCWLVDPSQPGSNFIYLDIVDRYELDRINPVWREQTQEPAQMIVDETSITLASIPDMPYTLYFECYRTPLTAEIMVYPAPTDTPMSPVIAQAHHRFLYHWALSVVYNMRDLDKYAPDRAKEHLDKFNDYFGLNIDADRGREWMKNRTQHNKVWN